MGFLGTYSNPAMAARLADVARELGDLERTPSAERPTNGYRLRRPGQILAALVEVLAAATAPMGPREIQVAAERLLNGPLHYGYVKQALSAHARSIEGAPLFDRADGRYWLARADDAQPSVEEA